MILRLFTCWATAPFGNRASAAALITAVLKVLRSTDASVGLSCVSFPCVGAPGPNLGNIADNGHDGPRLIDEAVLGLAAVVGVLGVLGEHTTRQPVVAPDCQRFSTGFKVQLLRRLGRSSGERRRQSR